MYIYIKIYECKYIQHIIHTPTYLPNFLVCIYKHMHIQTHANTHTHAIIDIVYIIYTCPTVEKMNTIYYYIYIYDKTYSIHKLIIHYSKHKLERAKYAHPFGKKIFLFLGLGVSRGGNSF